MMDFATANAVPQWNITANHTVGPFDPSSPDPEATLDTQYIGGLGQGSAMWYWTEADWQYEVSGYLIHPRRTARVALLACQLLLRSEPGEGREEG